MLPPITKRLFQRPTTKRINFFCDMKEVWKFSWCGLVKGYYKKTCKAVINWIWILNLCTLGYCVAVSVSWFYFYHLNLDTAMQCPFSASVFYLYIQTLRWSVYFLILFLPFEFRHMQFPFYTSIFSFGFRPCVEIFVSWFSFYLWIQVLLSKCLFWLAASNIVSLWIFRIVWFYK